MTMSSDDTSSRPVAARRLEVFTGVGQRRRWSAEDKAAVVAQSYAGLGTVSEIARRNGLASSQLFAWRRDARLAVEAPFGEAQDRKEAARSHTEIVPAPTFVPVVVEPVAARRPAKATTRRRSPAAAVELEIDGVSVRIARGAETKMIAAVIDALKGTR